MNPRSKRDTPRRGATFAIQSVHSEEMKIKGGGFKRTRITTRVLVRKGAEGATDDL